MILGRAGLLQRAAGKKRNSTAVGSIGKLRPDVQNAAGAGTLLEFENFGVVYFGKDFPASRKPRQAMGELKDGWRLIFSILSSQPFDEPAYFRVNGGRFAGDKIAGQRNAIGS